MHRIGEKRRRIGADPAVFSESPPKKKRHHVRSPTSRSLSSGTPSRLYGLYQRVAHWIMNAFSPDLVKDPSRPSEEECAVPTTPVGAEQSFSLLSEKCLESQALETEVEPSHGLLQHNPGSRLSEDVKCVGTINTDRCTEEADCNQQVIAQYFTSTPRADVDGRLLHSEAQDEQSSNTVLPFSTLQKTVGHTEVDLSQARSSVPRQRDTDIFKTHSTAHSDPKKTHLITASFQPSRNTSDVHSSVTSSLHSNLGPHLQNYWTPKLWSQSASSQSPPTHGRNSSKHISKYSNTSTKNSYSVLNHLSSLSSSSPISSIASALSNKTPVMDASPVMVSTSLNKAPVMDTFSPVAVSTSLSKTPVMDASVTSSMTNVKVTSLFAEQSVSRKKDLDNLSSWIQDIQTEHKHSQTERQMLLKLAHTKLLLCQRERQTVEDDMIGRLRLSLQDSHIQDQMQTPPPWALQDDHLNHVAMVMSGNNREECLSERYRIRICRSDLYTLEPTAWLNDEVMNFYFNLVQEYCNQSENIKIHIFNSFFYLKLTQAGYSGVRRWTKKVDLFSCDIILLPVHLGMHWCLAVVDMKSKQLIYYDSLLGNNVTCLQRLRDYLSNESLDKRKVPLDLSDWTNIIPKDIPRQENSWDCGVFTCMYARFKALNQPFTFSQGDMPNIRKMMVFEILQQEVLLQ